MTQRSKIILAVILAALSVGLLCYSHCVEPAVNPPLEIDGAVTPDSLIFNDDKSNAYNKDLSMFTGVVKTEPKADTIIVTYYKDGVRYLLQEYLQGALFKEKEYFDDGITKSRESRHVFGTSYVSTYLNDGLPQFPSQIYRDGLLRGETCLIIEPNKRMIITKIYRKDGSLFMEFPSLFIDDMPITVYRADGSVQALLHLQERMAFPLLLKSGEYIAPDGAVSPIPEKEIKKINKRCFKKAGSLGHIDSIVTDFSCDILDGSGR